ncbi:glycosyltransferase [bacterium]|nr:glycosyltransferase [bacterium]
MKVLVVTPMYPGDGRPHAGSFVHSQMESIRKKGIDVEVIDINEKRGVLKYCRAWLKLFRRSFDPGIDLIHAHYGFAGIISLLQWKLPVVVSFCGGDVLGNPDDRGRRKPEYFLLLPASWLLSLLVPAAIVKSAEMKRKLPAGGHISIVPNGVDMDMFCPVPVLQARARLGLDPKKRYILFPANPAWPRKCHPAAEAAVALLEERYKAELLVVHSGPPDAVPLYMNACDAMVLTSFWEGSPNVIKEAMACNLPIVSVDVGDVAEIISGTAHCFITARTPGAIASRLRQILDAGGRTNGRERIRHLEIGTIADRVISIYRDTLRFR